MANCSQLRRDMGGTSDHLGWFGRMLLNWFGAHGAYLSEHAPGGSSSRGCCSVRTAYCRSCASGSSKRVLARGTATPSGSAVTSLSTYANYTLSRLPSRQRHSVRAIFSLASFSRGSDAMWRGRSRPDQQWQLLELLFEKHIENDTVDSNGEGPVALNPSQVGLPLGFLVSARALTTPRWRHRGRWWE